MSLDDALLTGLRSHAEDLAKALAARLTREALSIGQEIGREIDNRIKDAIDEINSDLAEQEDDA